MAEAAISSAVETFGKLLIEYVGSLRGVKGEVEWVKRELHRMRGFLKDASERQAKDESIRQWISEIRDLAQDAQHVIETFILEIDNPRKRRGLLERCACFPSHLSHLNNLRHEIKSIKARLEEIIKSRDAYKIENIQGSFGRPYAAERRRLSPWQRGKHLVGLDEDVNLLLQKAVLEGTEGLSVISIVGMGGIGKSTLARAVYNHDEVAQRFDPRAWVVVSEQFNLAETIRELVLQLEPNENKQQALEIMKNSPEQHLKSMLHERLKGRRYFIVFDDVWRQQDWELLTSAFPDEEDKASRLIVTSRKSNVPRSAAYIHDMRTLDDGRSLELLLKTAFNDNTDIRTCPQELEDIGREIMRECNGLPLALTEMGSLLSGNKKSKSGWEKVLKGIDSHLGRSGTTTVQAVLELSYQDLPSHLKSCFLSLGFFEEDAIIHADRLVRIWIALGLVPQEEGEQTVEEIACGYLDELINRNMVQVQNFSRKDDCVITCQIHNLLRQLSIRKKKEEITFKDHKDVSHSFDQKPCHRVVYCRTTERLSNKQVWKGFKLRRVLKKVGLGFGKLRGAFSALIRLRYLASRNQKVHVAPNPLEVLFGLKNPSVITKTVVTVPVLGDVFALSQRLTQLNLEGWLIELPSACNFPPNLSSLTLKSSALNEDPMRVLEKLPKLSYLKLYMAYNGEEMVISSDGFPTLEVLHLVQLPKLSNIKVGEGGMPKLKRWVIIDCPKLREIPKELKIHMTDLQELKIETTPEINCISLPRCELTHYLQYNICMDCCKLNENTKTDDPPILYDL